MRATYMSSIFFTRQCVYDKNKLRYSKDRDTWLRALTRVCCDERRTRAS